MLNTIVPVASSIGAKNNPEELGEFLVSTTKYAVVLMLAVNLPLILLSRAVITLWVGASYATQTSHLFELLITANFVRQIGSPYFMIAIGCGEHKKIILSPLIEAFTNLFFSILLTMRIGAGGVAIGTIIGGITSIGLHFIYNLPRTTKIIVTDKSDLIVAIFKPILLVALPGVTSYLLINDSELFTSIWISTFSIFICWSILWLYGLDRDDRIGFYSTIEKAVFKRS